MDGIETSKLLDANPGLIPDGCNSIIHIMTGGLSHTDVTPVHTEQRMQYMSMRWNFSSRIGLSGSINVPGHLSFSDLLKSLMTFSERISDILPLYSRDTESVHALTLKTT